MATKTSLDFVQRSYVSYYGRPAEAEGLEYWAQRADEEGRGAIVNAFGTSREFTDQYGDLDNPALVNSLYQQLFSRDAEPEGQAFYVDQLARGEKTLAEIAVTIANAAQGNDKTVIDNKVAVAQAYTANRTGDDYNRQEAESLVDGINAGTPPEQVNDLKGQYGSGPTFTVEGTPGESSYSVADNKGVRFENVNSDQTINLNGLDSSKRVDVVNSSVQLNFDQMALDKLNLDNASTTLFSNDQNTATVLKATANGDSTLDLGSSAANGLQTLILDGSGNLNLKGATQGLNVNGPVNVDASQMSGSIDIAERYLNRATDIKTGTADDRININAVDGSYTLDGGGGLDTLVVTGSSSDTSLAAFGEKIGGIEVVEFDNFVKINAAELPGVGTITLDGLGNVNNLKAEQQIVANAQVDGPNDSSLLLDNAGETVNVSSRFTPDQPTENQELELKVNTSAPEAVQGGTLNLSGDAPIEYEDSGRGFDTIDASATSGGLELEGASYRAETIKLGSGADRLEIRDASTYRDMDRLENFDVNADELVNVNAIQANVDGAQNLDEAFQAAAGGAGGNTVYFGFEGSTYLYAENDDQPGLSGTDFAVELVGTPSDSVDGTMLTG
ncbi:DUF4214 domain-containing protein [Halomonas sp. PR-M31]|uniref:DUF4214 domain-containing protein n=1 Tax=Halomonas sp. PR-M31 TaxID=1471202 RepID=UPI0006505DD2|nr:DUF4214 domain-containing protein [Halomonas sp. PR-M31]